MNCKTIQRRLLALPNPERVSASVRHHLAGCPKCQEMHRRLVQVESHVPLLPVPSSSFAKAALLRRLQRGPTLRERVVHSLEALPGKFRQVGRTRLAIAGLAAALLLMLVGWKIGLGPTGPDVAVHTPKAAEPDPFLQSLFQHELNLAEASKPRSQVETLANLADDLNGSARSLAPVAEAKSETRDVADWYGKVLKTVVKRSEALAVADRRPVLGPLMQRLDQAAQATDRLAREIDAPANHPLRTIAAAARETKDQLDVLNKQEADARPRSTTGPLFGAVLPPLFAFGTVARAEETLSPADEARRFQRNYDLIEALVTSSLDLAMEEDPIRRAASCGRVARSLARAIEKAAADREGDRAAELGRHLRDQMQRGVVANLNVNAVTSRPLSSVREDALRKIDADMADMANIIGPLQDQLRPTADAGTHDSLQHTLQAIHDGRAEINKALQKSETK